MKQIHIDTKLLMLLTGFIFHGCLLAGAVSDPGSTAISAGGHTSGERAAREMELERLRQDLVRSHAEKQAVSEQNSDLHVRMEELESKILELRGKALAPQDGISHPEKR